MIISYQFLGLESHICMQRQLQTVL